MVCAAMPAASAVDNLAQAIHERRAILFAGAGLSMSVGLPSWSELIAHMAEELGLPQDVLSCRSTTYHTMAEYYRIRKGSVGPLRSWMDQNWRVSNHRIRESHLHNLIISLDFPIVYTTNYDHNIEDSYAACGRSYIKVANSRDIANAQEGVAQIVKFHGDFDDDSSLVLTETDYFNRLDFDSPLDIKFRSDSLGKTILFVGYSMTDINIRLLLHKLWRTWEISGFGRERPKSFVFMSCSNPMQEAVLEQWGLTTIAAQHEQEPEEALRSFLQDLNSRVAELRSYVGRGADCVVELSRAGIPPA